MVVAIVVQGLITFGKPRSSLSSLFHNCPSAMNKSQIQEGIKDKDGFVSPGPPHPLLPHKRPDSIFLRTRRTWGVQSPAISTDGFPVWLLPTSPDHEAGLKQC